MGKLWDLLQQHIDNAPYPPSERQIAAKLRISPSGLAKWRNPKQLPSRENLQALADLVGVRYSVVLDAALYDTGYHESVAQIIPIRRPLSTIEAELQVAAEDLAEYEALNVTGKAAESKRAALRSRVDSLKAELDSSRRAIGETDSVAEL
jgi:transcriptional regulator with XRE-family HTH domain